MSVYMRLKIKIKARKHTKKMTVMRTLFSMFSMIRWRSIYDIKGVSFVRLDSWPIWRKIVPSLRSKLSLS